MAAKLDLKKKPYKHLYYPPAADPVLVDVPPLQFVMIDGAGDPNTSQAFGEAASALYGVAYTLKFMSKELGTDFTVMPLEGLWWADDMTAFTAEGRKDDWFWTSVIMVPDWITPDRFAAAREAAAAKKDLPALPKMRLETYHEGLAVQIMHIGPFADEGPTLKRLHEEYLPANGYVENGKHHEIYLSDPRRTAPDKLKTVLRQLARKA